MNKEITRRTNWALDQRLAADTTHEHGLRDITSDRVTGTDAPKARPNPGEGDTSSGIYSAEQHERNTAGVDRRHWTETTVIGGDA